MDLPRHADLRISRMRPAYALFASCAQRRPALCPSLQHSASMSAGTAEIPVCETLNQQHVKSMGHRQTCISAAGASNSATRPAASTMTRSQSAMVSSRCAMVRTVHRRKAVRMVR